MGPWRHFGSLTTHREHSKDSDLTAQMSRLIWLFAGRTYNIVGKVVLWLLCCLLHFALYTWIKLCHQLWKAYCFGLVHLSVRTSHFWDLSYHWHHVCQNFVIYYMHCLWKISWSVYFYFSVRFFMVELCLFSGLDILANENLVNKISKEPLELSSWNFASRFRTNV